MKFCSACGAEVVRKIPPDDDHMRFVCESCGAVYYHNPKIVVGCIPEKDGKILLCRRAIEPRLGFWTLPAGFMEMHETMAGGAAREALEETGARVEIIAPFTLLDLVHAGQVYVMFRANLLDDNYGPTQESLEVRLFDEADIPWGKMAFTSITYTLEKFFGDRAAGTFVLHESSIGPMGLHKP